MSSYGKLNVDVDCLKGGPSKTKQSFAEESDINKIVARFEKSGMVDNLNQREPFYGDVSDIGDYQECLNVVNRSRELFNAMDANVRSRFDNDPVKMIEFLQDAKNFDEAVELGMAVKRPVEPVVAPVVPKP